MAVITEYQPLNSARAGPSDAIIDSARQGDRAAMEQLLRRAAPMIARFVRRLCRSDHDLDDVLQESLLAIARNLQKFERRSSFDTWAFVVARSACTRRRRRPGHRGDRPLDASAPIKDIAPLPDEVAAQTESRRALERALQDLPDELRAPVLLRDADGLSAEEAAAALGLSVPALKSRLHRGRAALRLAMRPPDERISERREAACPDVVAALSRDLEGDASRSECEVLSAHVATCQSCSEACASLRSVLQLCESARSRVPAANIERALREAIDAWITRFSAPSRARGSKAGRKRKVR